ncbi:MAG: DUF4199 domain-containing protein [Bacteroidota bacterium]
MFKSPLFIIVLRYGTIAGVIGFGLLVILYYLGRHPFVIPVFFDFRIILFALLLVFSLRDFREFHNEGILYFWQGMMGSFVLTFFYALVSSILLFAFASWEKDFVSSFIELTLEQAKSYPPEDIERMGKETFEQGLKAILDADAAYLARRYFFQSFIISFFISIIISVILRRQPKTL